MPSAIYVSVPKPWILTFDDRNELVCIIVPEIIDDINGKNAFRNQAREMPEWLIEFQPKQEQSFSGTTDNRLICNGPGLFQIMIALASTRVGCEASSDDLPRLLRKQGVTYKAAFHWLTTVVPVLMGMPASPDLTEEDRDHIAFEWEKHGPFWHRAQPSERKYIRRSQ